ncbi:MAG: tRNA (guanosine(46)-N7)-methyltransferase TrmB [Alphaproteobacteria bacterium]
MPEGNPSRIAERPPIRVHGRKRSHRLSHTGQKMLEGLLPLVAVPLAGVTGNPVHLFTPPCREVWLEIGFGDGGHLAWAAAANPEVGFIGCEPYVNGVAHLLEVLSEQGLRNIRIHAGDARDILAALPVNSITQVFILFPDPWPRKRHHKRRFICPANLDALARIMQPDAELHFASDSPGYCQWTMGHMQNHSGFAEAVHERGDAPETKYEAKARAAGRLPRYLRFIRTPIAHLTQG